MNLRIKLYRSVSIILCLLSLFASCDKNTDDEDFRYMFGLTSAINSNNEEIEAIETAYCDAYKNEGLKFSSQLFAHGTYEEEILKACREAENAILTSSIKFDGKYTYEIKYIGHSIYHKSYGTR